jgi:hypothetical protein
MWGIVDALFDKFKDQMPPFWFDLVRSEIGAGEHWVALDDIAQALVDGGIPAEREDLDLIVEVRDMGRRAYEASRDPRSLDDLDHVNQWIDALDARLSASERAAA